MLLSNLVSKVQEGTDTPTGTWGQRGGWRQWHTLGTYKESYHCLLFRTSTFCAADCLILGTASFCSISGL